MVPTIDDIYENYFDIGLSVDFGTSIMRWSILHVVMVLIVSNIPYTFWTVCRRWDDYVAQVQYDISSMDKWADWEVELDSGGHVKSKLLGWALTPYGVCL